MSRKTIIPDVRGLLLEGNFGASRDLPATDPLTTTQMLLEIKPYDRNPRRELNPRYHDIKDSIRAHAGLNNPLTVTRRPGDELFMVESGGNTRLMILKELWQETQHESFRRVHCLFVPWKSESHVLSAHLIENELRGEMLLIDKAVALKDLQMQLEQESGCRLSRSEFQRRLAAKGYTISRRQMIRYEYAAEALEPLIPRTLRGGLGRHQIDRIRDIEQAYRVVHRSLSASAPAPLPAFDPWFADVLAGQDGDTPDLTTARREIDCRLAELSGHPLNRIRIEMDALLHETSEERDEAMADREIPDGARSDVAALGQKERCSGTGNDTHGGQPKLIVAKARPIADADGPASAAATAAPKPDRSIADSDRDPDSNANDQLLFSMHETDAEPALFPDERLNTEPRRLPRETDLKSLRSRAYVLALKIAQGLGFKEAVHPWKSGYGFVLDLPDRNFRDDRSWYGWWQLFGLSEQSASEERLALAPNSLRLPVLLREGREHMIFEIVDKPPGILELPLHLLLSRQISDQVFHDLLLLMEGCRTLRKQFRESDLWECITVEQVRMRALLAEIERKDDG